MVVVLKTLLLAFLVAKHCTTATIALCSNPPPGVAKMVRGVDITSLDLLPLDGLTSQGAKFPIISLTCNTGSTWTSPCGEVYERPDQIWSLTTIPHGFSAAQAMVYRSMYDVRFWLNLHAGIEGEYYNLTFSGSASYKKMQRAIYGYSKQIEDVMSFESTSRADFIPYWQLKIDPFAQMYIDHYLPGHYNESTMHAYRKFIELFGTHYFASANFGGIIRSYMETDQLYARYKSDEEIKLEAMGAFEGTVDLGQGEMDLRISGFGKIRTGIQQTSERFYRATTAIVRYYGGNTDLMTSKGINKWHKSVDRDPWLFSGKLFPITNLIRNSFKRRSLKRAVRQYIWRSYIKDLYRLVISVKLRIHHPIIDSLQKQIENQLKLPHIQIKKAWKLSQAVFYHLLIPSWFTEETHLCFKWKASSDSGKPQCNKGAGHLECTKPNGQTKSYIDDTNELDGGCKMQWGIYSTSHDAWFRNVSICFRWQATADSSQCGGGLPRKVCSPVNSFTPEYLDNTDNRLGGCQMSWKLEVEDDAPVWLQTAKLCFEWSADGDMGQCGPVLGRDKCVSTNHWTSYYTDQTDEREGGCLMSWGWYLPMNQDASTKK